MIGPDTFAICPRALPKLGLPIERLGERAGVAPSNALVTSVFFRIWAAAGEELGDRSAGLRFGAEGIDRGTGVAGIAALHAPDFRHALASLARYKRLTCPELVKVEIEGEEAIVRYRWLQATDEVPRLLVDTTMSSLRELARRGTAGRPRLPSIERRTTATRLFANTELDTVAIAMMLGFAEPNSFAHAFRAWERTTPLRWRERQTSDQTLATEESPS